MRIRVGNPRCFLKAKSLFRSMNPDHPIRGDPVQCRICGDHGGGLQYGLTCCESCKGFYKRYADKPVQFQCGLVEACLITVQTRSRCKTCRYAKCIELGMHLDAVVPDTQTEAGSHSRLARGHYGVLAPAASGSTRLDTARDRSRSPASEPAATSAPRSFAAILSRIVQHSVDDLTASSVSSSVDQICRSRRIGMLQRFSAASMRSFADDSLDFMLNDTGPVRPCRVPDIAMPGSRSLQEVMEPSVLQKYWGVMRVRDNLLEDCVRAVSDAMEAVFGDRIRSHEECMDLWHDQGLVPFQPQCSLAYMRKLVQRFAVDFFNDLLRFTHLFPGLKELNQADRLAMVQDRMMAAMICFSSCIRDDESYHTLYGIHHSNYWNALLVGEDLRRFFFSVYAELNDLHLSPTEQYLLLTVALLRIDAANVVQDEGYVDFLHAHYFDALIHLIGPARSRILPNLQAVLKRFTIVNEVRRRFFVGASEAKALFKSNWESSAVVSLVDSDPDSFERRVPPATNLSATPLS